MRQAGHLVRAGAILRSNLSASIVTADKSWRTVSVICATFSRFRSRHTGLGVSRVMTVDIVRVTVDTGGSWTTREVGLRAVRSLRQELRTDAGTTFILPQTKPGGTLVSMDLVARVTPSTQFDQTGEHPSTGVVVKGIAHGGTVLFERANTQGSLLLIVARSALLC